MGEHRYRPSEGHRLAHDPLNWIVTPRPIGWISTVSTSGIRNLAPYSFFNVFSYRPPIVGFTSTGWKDSVENIRDTGEFTWNLVSVEQAEAMNITSAEVKPDRDEFELAGLTGSRSTEVRPDRVAGAPVSFECVVTDQHRLRDRHGDPIDAWMTLGEVVMVHIDDRLIRDGAYDPDAVTTVARLGGPTAYAAVRPDARFDMRRPG